MPESEPKYFQLLKKEISKEVRRTFPGNAEEIEKWKGVEITNFQEDLGNKVNGRISEKWFYTHIKSQKDSLPRVDILDLLSEYVGYKSWADYKSSVTDNEHKSNKFEIKKPLFYVLGLILIITIVWSMITALSSKSHEFCFINAYSQKPAIENDIEVWVLRNDESPYSIKVNPQGCFTITSSDQEVKFVVKSPYYKTDTIVRKLDKNILSENVPLEVDDYALMIHIFSNAKLEDWEARRAQLNSMIAADARIYQIFESGNIGMEMYNKEEFINKLTVPLNSLRNIEVVESIYRGDKIKTLRFRQMINIANE